MVNNIAETLDDFNKLQEYIEREVERRIKISSVRPYSSPSIDTLSAALSAAQGEFKPVPYNRCNASWNDDYTDMDILMKELRPVLCKHKLALTQWTELTAEGSIVLHTELSHASGQWRESRIRIVPGRNDIKTFDSTLNDFKRSQAMLLLNLTLEGDPKDDDGDLAMVETHEELALPKSNKLVRSKASFESVTAEQLLDLERELSGYPDLAEELMAKYAINSLSDMPKSKCRFALEQIRRLKMYRSGESTTVR